MQPITLFFLDKTIQLNTLLNQLSSLLTLPVHTDMLADENKHATRSAPGDETNEEISVYQFKNQFIILTGRPSVEEALLKGDKQFNAKFVSKQALKHMISLELNAAAPYPQEMQPYYAQNKLPSKQSFHRR